MIKIGIVGAGGIARGHHIPAFQKLTDRCQLQAIADVNLEVAQSLAKDAGIPHVFASHLELLAGTDVDVVIVTTPNRFHFQPTVDSLNAGKHVLCEKPMGMNGEEARQMVEASKKNGRVLQVGLQLRFSGAANFLFDFIKRGEMGDIYYARAQALRRRGVPGWGVFIDKEKQGGGALIDIGVHILDLTLAAMDYPKPVSASAGSWNLLGTNPDLYNSSGDYDRSKFTVEDFAAGIVRFENGAMLSVESCFMANLGGNMMQTQLFGSKAGALLLPGAPALTLYGESGKQLLDMTPANIPTVDAAVKAASSFFDAVEGKSPCVVTGEHGYVLNAIMDALYASAESGHEEHVKLAL